MTNSQGESPLGAVRARYYGGLRPYISRRYRRQRRPLDFLPFSVEILPCIHLGSFPFSTRPGPCFRCRVESSRSNPVYLFFFNFSMVSKEDDAEWSMIGLVAGVSRASNCITHAEFASRLTESMRSRIIPPGFADLSFSVESLAILVRVDVFHEKFRSSDKFFRVIFLSR